MKAHPTSSQTAMLHTIAQWSAKGWLRSLDEAFVRFLHDLEPSASPLVLLAAALASHQLGRGHVCLDLQAALADSHFALSLPPDAGTASSGEANAQPLHLPSDILAGVSLAHWQSVLQASALVDGNASTATPLVLQGSRLYLRRYWQHEQDVMAAISARLAQSQTQRMQRTAAQDQALRHALDVLFAPSTSNASKPASSTHEPDWQKVACALAATSAFAIITGGPGTGKTTTVVKLLALLQSMAVTGLGSAGVARPLRICLAAPTGKAAARLTASIVQALARLQPAQLPETVTQPIKDLIPSDAQTLHRLLGSKADSRHFRHNAQHPLALDVLVVDEASMVDLEMMAALLNALPPQAHLVLLGDKDQLASVEAGSVLGELCAQSERGLYWEQTAQWLQSVTGQTIAAHWQDMAGKPLEQAIVMLRTSHRFDAASGIGQLARAVHAGDRKAARQVLRSDCPDLAAYAVPDVAHAALSRLVVDGGIKRFTRLAHADAGQTVPVGYAHYLSLLHSMPEQGGADALNAWAQQLLQAHSRFQVLCALRNGPWGVQGLNVHIAQLLAQQGLIAQSTGWYAGRPVLVTRNDYSLQLMNGDVGIVVQVPLHFQELFALAAQGETAERSLNREAAGQHALRVVFATRDGLRWVLPSRLQAVETVFAMTIHKSQGSEFDHAAVVLPPGLGPILTRELVYTGITRAKNWLTLVAGGASNFAVLEQAIGRQVHRASGLRQGDL